LIYSLSEYIWLETYIGIRSLEYALFGFLYEQPCYAISLHQLVVTNPRYIWKVSRSQTYAILKRLVEQGYITSNTAKQEKLSRGEVDQAAIPDG
jgi:DNA-binding PadR family transcriptional regulator